MDAVSLILTLRPLLADPGANFAEIIGLLDKHDELAEYEVARFLVGKHLGPVHVAEYLRSPDPEHRARCVDLIRLTCGRNQAAQLLRPLVKDPVMKVRGRARKAIRYLGLDDVALPNPAASDGGWNPTGWSFGNLVHPTRPANLARYGLPEISGRAQLATLLGVDSADFARLMRPGEGPGAPYVEFEVAKARGGVRRIAAPRAELKRVQRVILAEILARVPVHDACHGFVAGRSVVSNARPHIGAAVVVKLDLADFFPTVHYRRVAGLFRHLGYGDAVADTLAGLTTHRPTLADGGVGWPGVLPQGAPTSPAIANLVCRRMDARLAGLAGRVEARYTRYADDMTFSFASAPTIPLGRLLWWVEQICGQEGFVEKLAKRRILRPSNQQRVTGIVVNSGLFVPRAARRRFRAILANCRKHGVASQARDRADFPAYLRGFAAYVSMVQPELGARLVAEVDALLAGDDA